MSKLTTTRELIIPIPKGGAVEMVDGRLDASYYPLSTGLGVVATLIAARNGQFPRPSVMVDHLNDSLAIEIDRLVELHLEQFRAALFKAIKSETSECEFHVLRPTLELRFQLPDCDACEMCAHEAAQATGGAGAESTEKREALS